MSIIIMVYLVIIVIFIKVVCIIVIGVVRSINVDFK